MKTYSIGICGPVSGLSDHQRQTILEHINEVLRVVKRVDIKVWRDTGSRHPVLSERADWMTAEGVTLCAKARGPEAVMSMKYVEYGGCATELLGCDTLFICPGHAHTRHQKSRVSTVWKQAEERGMRPRIVFSWKHETNHL